jgi:photosystem II stability/assembly factor-like uncharacterized protein
MGRCGEKRRPLVGSVAVVGLLLAGSVPAVGQEGGSVPAQVTMEQAEEVCVLIGVAELDFGTLDFDASADSDQYTVESCSTADQELYAHATGASGDGVPPAQWGLVDGAGDRQIDEFAVDAELVEIGDSWLGAAPVAVGMLPASASAQAGHQLVMPPAGSAGAGQTFSFDIVWTATLEDSDATWTLQSSGVTGVSLWDVAFVDAQRGWAVGEGGTIVATTNGGATWTPQDSGTTAILRGVAFVDAQRGWTVGDNGTILVTTDGGVSWTAQIQGTTWPLYDVVFLDAQRGWAVGEWGTIVATTDGGMTWTAQDSATTRRLWGVAFVDGQRGWAVGDYETIRATTDGGVTWTAQTAATIDPDNQQLLLGVTFVDAQTGWVVGTGGTILATADGGDTWTVQTSGTAAWLHDVAFVDAQRGWAVGDFDTILTTTDGGATWTAQTSATENQYLLGVAFVNAQTGWAVGANGTIMRYG